MKHLARFSGLIVALCFGLPATGFAHDHHHNDHCDWHPRYSCGPNVRFYGSSFGYYNPYPFYGYYSSPSFGVSISTAPSATYRGAQVEDRGDGLTADVQDALRHDGYYRGDVDGDIGPETRAAIRQYQYDHGLEVTGRIDRALLHSLRID